MRRALLVVLFTALSAVTMFIYCQQVLSGVVQPRLASWVIFLIGSILSLVSYFASAGKHNATNNLANIADVLATLAVIVVLTLQGSRLELSTFDQYCLFSAGGIVVIWMFAGHTTANLLLQGLMIVGYFPMIRSLWSATQNSESFVLWGTALVTSSIALCMSWRNRRVDPLAPVYAIRACILVGILLALMFRIELS
ncbi:MAG: hypothetical protein ACD_81C00078G0002 [uncultured bacterium]|uniref:Uncharacterized protein n=1 Tax=Candidatus Wolfebacteria bacterium GW2011_GWE2_44_13 TaxID=1619017 RepID=A0A0G1K5T2_9BACT|nr:MAG: hypothetical protein ACD_81C00078G0002 [uncultured bacterium]KKT43174.1 MAG: hypothetical protein UW32_C0002G0035 [Candidatus Wolfebacteria bacterium GW2011_GWE2_44_13]